MGLHPLWHFNTEQCHTVLDDLSHILGNHQTGNLLCFGISVEDAVIMIELVELLSQLIAVVCNTTWALVDTSLCNCSTEVIELLDECNLLLIEWSIVVK